MNRILVWDIPTRLFHWLLAGSFVGAFIIANTFDDESATFAVHMLLGAVMALMVVLRVAWGFFGSRWARFGSFAFGPAAILDYLKGTVTGDGRRYVGHNPGSSVAIFAILGLTLALGLSGALMSTLGEALEEVHEVLAWALLAVVVAHVAGVVWHTVRLRENIALSMITGRKRADAQHAIRSSHPAIAAVFLAITGAWAWGLVQNYDAATSSVRLPVIGTTLHLGEAEVSPGSRGEAQDDD